MPDLHRWITQQIEIVERRARACTATDWRHVFDGVIVDRDTDGWQHAPDSARIASVAYERIYWSTNPAHSPDADHIVCNDPDTVLRRCEADRRVLARHRLNPDAIWYEAAMCEGCGTDGEMAYPRTANLNDCPELLDLAHAHGLTLEILATLDRPQEGERPERTGPSLIPDAIAEAMASRLFATFLGTRPVEPRPEVKALEILEPELKKIPGYVPVPKDPGPAG